MSKNVGRPEGATTDPRVLEITKLKELLRSKEKILAESRKSEKLELKNAAKKRQEEEKNKQRERDNEELKRRQLLGLPCDDLIPEAQKKRLAKARTLIA